MNQPTDVTAVVIQALETSQGVSIRKKMRYRMFTALRKQEAIYKDPILVAARLSGAFTILPEDISDQELEKIAEFAVQSYNDSYLDIAQDLGDKGLANQVFQIFSGNE